MIDAQIDLFGTRPVRERIPAHQRHSATSKAAAVAVKPKLNALQADVLGCIRILSGATDAEIQAHLHMDPSTERPRRVELVVKGLIRDSGRTRATPSGRQAVVWEAVG
jgi:hypothetical protein